MKLMRKDGHIRRLKLITEKFQFLKDHLQKAQSISDPVIVNYQIGASVLAVSYYSGLNKCFSSSVEHIKTQSSRPPDFTINCFSIDANTSLPFKKEQYGRQGLLDGFNDENHYASFQHGADTYSFYDQNTRSGYYLVRDVSILPFWEVSAPFRNIIHWWTRDSEYQMIHSAHLDFDGTGMLISGKGGSGKSSTALSSLLHGHRTLGEDYLLVDTHSLTAYSLFRTAKLSHDAIKRFPHLNNIDKAKYANEEKIAFFLDDYIQNSLIARGKLKYHFLPKINKTDKTAIQQVDQSEGFKQLAPSTIFQLPRLQESTFLKCSQLCKSLKTYRILLGTEPNEIHHFLEQFAKNQQ